MALRPAYGFAPYGFGGLPAGPYGFGRIGQGEMLPEGFDSTLIEETVVAPKKRRGVSRKPGKVVRCKIVRMKQRDGAFKKRKLCWDKHGVLASNTKPGARSKGARKA